VWCSLIGRLYATAAGVVLLLLAAGNPTPVCCRPASNFLTVASLLWYRSKLSCHCSLPIGCTTALHLKTGDFSLGQVREGNLLRIVNVHSGYDETSSALRNLFGNADISTIDLFPALGRREPSIVRARKLYPPSG
jgi:hypothetical protein